MDSKQDKSKIEKLKKALYSRNTELPNTFYLDLRKHESETTKDWDNDDIDIKAPEKSGMKKISLYLLVATFVFFVVALCIALFIYIKGTNIVSPSNININVIGPVTISAGEEVDLDFSIANNNETNLELADLIVEYPKGTRTADEKRGELLRERIPVGDISSNEILHKTIKAVFFDEEGGRPKIKYSLEYRLQGSENVFNLDGVYEMTVGSSPVSLKVDMLKEINSNQDLEIKATVSSNSNEVVKNLLLVAELPFGFEVKSVSPEFIKDKTVWNLGDLEPNGERQIKLIVRVVGVENEERFVKFSIGGQSSDDSTSVDNPFVKLSTSVQIKKPFLAVDLFVDGGIEGNFAVKPGETILSRISWQNNLNTPIVDTEVSAQIKSALIDKKNVSVDGGFYRSSTDTITWTKFESSDLALLPPGEVGTLNFRYILFDAFSAEAKKLKNQDILVDITIKGKRLSENNVPEEIVSTVSKRIKIETDPKFSSSIMYSQGPFKNTGPYPTVVDKKTEFTITWNVTNSLNDIDNGKVTAVLPSYVNWIGKISPTSEKVIYDNDSRTVTWELGKVLSGGGLAGSLRQVAFQVDYTPSISQLNYAPVISNLARFSARDTFTNTTINLENKPLSTALSGDPIYHFGDEKVREK